MRVLFVGSKGMGAMALDELVRQDADIVAVVCRWDDPNSGQRYPSVTERARHHGFEPFTPNDINDPQFVDELAGLQPDLMLTAFYPKIYRAPLLEIPPLGSLNLHFAPLPRYRGSWPGAWAIINGETRHGVTLHKMTPAIDAGDIVAQEFFEILPEDTGQTLYAKCEEAGLRLLQTHLPQILQGEIDGTPQDERRKLFYGREKPYSGIVDFNWTTKQIVDYVRALTFPPFENPAVVFGENRFIILKAVPGDGPPPTEVPGTILSIENSITVKSGDGTVQIVECAEMDGEPASIGEITSRLGLEVGAVLGR